MGGTLTHEEMEKRVHDLETQVLELRRFEWERQDQLKKFRVMYDLAIAMTTERSLDENLQLVVDKSRELLGTDTCYIALVDEKRGDVFMHSLSGIRTEEFKNIRVPFGEGLGGLIAKTRRGYIIEDYFTDKNLTRKLNEIVAGEGLISGMAVPIQMGETNLGVLYAFNRKKAMFSQPDLDTLFLIGNLAAIEIARKLADEKLRRTNDELEQRVVERTEELAQSNVQLKQEIAERKRAMDTVRESERRLRTLLDFAPYPIVVFDLEGRVIYLNPTFTDVFGWSLSELQGRRIPYVPRELEEDSSENIKRLLEERRILRYETKRLTKGGSILDVIIRGAIYVDAENEPAGELVIVRDITHEKRLARNNETMLRVSMALPEYPELDELLDYVSREIKELTGTEGGIVTLFDEERKEFFFLSAAYDDQATQKRVKGMRFGMEMMEQFVVPKVALTGKPVIVNDTSKVPRSYPVRDKALGYQTRNFLQVALKSSDRIIGALTAINKKKGVFDHTDVEMLSMIGGAVALSIENARFSEELKDSYREVTSLNRAKDKVFHHLSHELKTPAAVLVSAFRVLSKRLSAFPEETWKPTLERARRNLNRIIEIQYQVDDIIQDRESRSYDVFSLIFDQCLDELESLMAEELGENSIIEKVRGRIEEIFGTKEMVPERVFLNEFVNERIDSMRPRFSNRRVNIKSRLEPVPAICMPVNALRKVVEGLIRNAIENTPDEGEVEVVVERKGETVELTVRDSGIGILEDHQRRIFEGFFSTQESMGYSSKRPFEFNAGGKGADLLRMKIFSERHNFRIDMTSKRCGFIPKESDICPGRISECSFCTSESDCFNSGGTIFSVYFQNGSQG